ncbi:Processed sterol regulatory element-binding 1 [Hyphodiscus hymeniophilus]|uniref:Processed sterol regulatory element-binding 1 n=1 Tax=Hyphodiscus hymeniophilus TaxID=353542 RepID=A0A9P6VDJ2_9HELO|nr:Processed sterol regulatory element-binding 1 [Hyphodiscus hymeniophilus]
MAACCQQPSADYFSTSPVQKSQNTNILRSPHLWEQGISEDLSLSPEQCDSSYSTLPSPIESPTTKYPDPYILPKGDLRQPYKADQIFDFGSCDDWASWDDHTDNALSPMTTDFFPEVKMEPSTPNMMGLELQPAANQFQNQPNGTDELSAVFGDDQMDAPLFQIADQPRENLYSTPLSWSPPSGSTGIRNPESYSFPATLSPRQQSRLIAQAMPSRSRTYPTSPSTASSPEPEQHPSGLKRKSTSYASEDDEEDSSHATSSERHLPVKKTAHNMIEKRYRTNLNDKIAALRDSVPSLRIITRRNARGEEVEEDLDGLTPAHKLNKATILSKATEYIAHIERRNKILTKETAALKSRIEAFEILMMAQEPPPPPQQPRNSRIQSRQPNNPMYGME